MAQRPDPSPIRREREQHTEHEKANCYSLKHFGCLSRRERFQEPPLRMIKATAASVITEKAIGPPKYRTIVTLLHAVAQTINASAQRGNQ